MKKYMSVIKKLTSFGSFDYDALVCELTASDVDEAVREYKKYLKKKGRVYELDVYKTPTTTQFVNIYFGDYDEYGSYDIPNRFICTNKNVASRLSKILVDLNFHDTFNQVFCNVVCDGRYIDIVRGEY